MRARLGSWITSWGAWCVLIFFLWNGCARHRDAQATGRLLASGQYRPSASLAVRALLAVGTDDGDISRYLAYVNAALGRPYQGYYVRPLNEWKVDARLLYTGKDVNDPLETPPVVPAAPLMPYRDFLVEYPPGFFLFAVPPALLAGGDLDRFHLLFSSLMGTLLTVALVLAVRLAPTLSERPTKELVKFATGAALALGIIAVRRYDAAVSLSLCLLVWGCARRRPFVAALAIALGVAVKGLPVLLAPLVVLYYVAGRRYRELAIVMAVGAATGLATGLPFTRAVGRQAFDMFAYHGGRPLQVESTGGALLVVARLFTPGSVASAHTYGSANVIAAWDGPVRTLAGVLPLIGLLGVFAWAFLALRRVARPGDSERVLLRSLCAGLVVCMVLGKVFSPQYLTWLLPLGLLAAFAEGGRGRWIFIGSLVLTQIIYPFAYRVDLANSLHPAFGALVLARNALLLAWTFLLLFPSVVEERTEAVLPAGRAAA